LNKSIEESDIERKEPLKVFVQINTSKEENKGGVEINESEKVIKFVIENCKRLKFSGLMTIGAYDNSVNEEDKNPDFESLVECRDKICKSLELNKDEVEIRYYYLFK
jgi:PLP dependent protein